MLLYSCLTIVYDRCFLVIPCQAKHQKHQAFQAELAANSDRIGSVVKMGESKTLSLKPKGYIRCLGSIVSFCQYLNLSIDIQK